MRTDGVYVLHMKTILSIIAVIVACVFFAPAAAYADDIPPAPAPYDDVNYDSVDCETGILYQVTIHMDWYWQDGEWLAYGVGEDRVQAPAYTGGGVPADCPWWEWGEDGYWVDTRLPAEPIVDWAPGTAPDSEPDAYEGDGGGEVKLAATVWKLGING